MSRLFLQALLLFILLPLLPLEAGPAFRNVAEDAGLGGTEAMRMSWVDLDGDGFPDLVCHGFDSRDPKNVRSFLNRPGPKGRRFVEIPEAGGLRAMGPSAFAVAGDVDGDGDLDLFCAASDGGKEDHEARSTIFLNDGTGRFEAGQSFEPLVATSAALFADVNRDGNLDLFVGNWYRAYGKSLEAHVNRLYLGDGKGRFRDATKELGLATTTRPGQALSSRPTYGVAHTDTNNDGWPELLVCNYGRQWNRLWTRGPESVYRDVGPDTNVDGDADRSGRYPRRTKEFFKKRYGRERADEPPFRANGNTFDAACADFDNDGDVDIFLAEIAHAWAGSSSDRSTLLVNQGPPDFTFERDRARGIDREHEGANWNEGDIHAGWLDADGDGRLDLLLASSDYPDNQRLRLFRQTADHRFQNVTADAGIDWRNPTQISLADYDRDGDMDIVCGNTFMRLSKEQRKGMTKEIALWRNESPAQNWLGLRLHGGGTNRAAIGARVLVTTGSTTRMREVYGGQGHAGHQDDLSLLFGLGEADRIDRVEIRWPGTDTRTLYENISINSYYDARRGDDSPSRMRFGF